MTRTSERKQAYNKAYHEAHREELLAYGKTYREAHREEARAYARRYCKAYYAAHREERLAHNKTCNAAPRARAAQFLRRNPDCTSTVEEIGAIYAASIDMTTGLPGKIGRGNHDLVLDHVHDGPAVGLIPGWLNRAITYNLDVDVLARYLEKRRRLI